MSLAPRYCPSCLSTFSQISTTAIRHHGGATPLTALQRTPLISKSNYHSSTPLLAASGPSKSQLEQRARRKKKQQAKFAEPDISQATQFSLVDAMRYLRAVEVGRGPASSKYELHVRLRSPKNGPVVRNRLRLPHPVNNDLRIAVICPPDSAIAKKAIADGASLVGEESIFDAVKDGRIEFDRCLCHQDSLPKLGKSGIARILGPRGLMPSAKLGTVTKEVGKAVRELVGGSEYRERVGVIRMAVGQLGFTPEEVQRNIRVFMDGVRTDIANMSDRVTKSVHEVVLSSTNGPGFSLTGELRSAKSIPTSDLSTF